MYKTVIWLGFLLLISSLGYAQDYSFSPPPPSAAPTITTKKSLPKINIPEPRDIVSSEDFVKTAKQNQQNDQNQNNSQTNQLLDSIKQQNKKNKSTSATTPITPLN